MANETHHIHSPKIREIIRNKYGGKCAYCGCVLTKLHIDHIEPKRRHLMYRSHTQFDSTLKCGEDHISNYNPSCMSCNSSKGSLDIEQFREQIKGRHDYMMKYFSEYRSMIKFNRISVNEFPVTFYFETINGKKIS